MNRILVRACVLVLTTGLGRVSAGPLRVSVDLAQAGKPISPDLVGIFFEDINYAADGGLYAELVQNRSFEYAPVEQNDWNPLTAWEQVSRGNARGSLKIMDAVPVHANNPHYIVIDTQQPGEGFGLANGGFDGIVVRAGEAYEFSLFARQLFTGTRWGGSGRLDGPSRLAVRLESRDGAPLAEAPLEVSGRDWQRLAATLTPVAAADAARLVVLSLTRGGIAVDMISLFPRATFRNRPNGLRADLAQAIADLQPKFMRFPGGCLVHGYSLGNLYRWEDTVGPVEQRRAQPNIWGYHQTLGLGYHEYFQFCEDIGAKPLPVVAAGVCCQNADYQGGTGQRGIPLEEMPAYIQTVLDLIEWANGPATSRWGAVRAAAGHPAPFNLEYLGVGNEDHITPVFRERFQMIFEAVKAKHPEITVIGTVGPSPDGADYENGWQIANELGVPMVDEHYYQAPQWFWDNLGRYDGYDRRQANVYVGEYAAHDDGRRTTLRSALAEAAYLTGLERNGDVVPFASYAPLLGKRARTQWNPNLIYFSDTQVAPTINYYVQQLFSLHGGDRYLEGRVEEAEAPDPAAPLRTGLFLGTWHSQAEFDEIRVTSGSATLLRETFDAAAPDWRPETGAWSVADGVYRQTGAQEPALSRLPAAVGAADYTVTLRARKTGGAEGFLIGFGAQDPAHYYWWNLGGWENARHAVEKTGGGSRRTVGRAVPGRIESGRWYDIRIDVAGPRIRCLLDNTLVHEFTDRGFADATPLAVSCVRDTRTGDVVLKLVNGAPDPSRILLDLAGAERFAPTATRIVLAGDPMAVNDFDRPRTVVPETGSLTVGRNTAYDAPANSLSVIRLHAR